MNMVLTAIYEEVPDAEGGGYVAYTEELPGAISEGDTLEEASENLRDAIEQLLAANRQMSAASKTRNKVTRETIAVSIGRQ